MLLKDRLKLFLMKKIFKDPLCFFSDLSQAMSGIQKDRARSVENLTFRIDGLEDFLLQRFLIRKFGNLFLKMRDLDLLQLLKKSSQPFAQYHLIMEIQ